MLRSCLPLLSAWLTLGGCSSAPPPAGEAGRPVTSLSDIAGPWDIASFDGYEPVRLTGGVRRAFVDVAEDGLHYAIECNYSGNPARIDAGGVLHDTGDGSRMQTQMGCGPEREARDSALFGFFATRPRVSRAPGGRLRMSNGRSELILERPEVRRLAHLPRAEELTGRWVPQMALQTQGTGHSGWGFQEAGIVTFGPGRVDYFGCGGWSFAFRYTAEGKLETSGGPDKTTCGQDAQSTMLLRVLRAGPLAERMKDGGIALSAGAEVVTLQSGAELRRLQNMPMAPPANGFTPPPPPPPPPSAPQAPRGR